MTAELRVDVFGDIPDWYKGYQRMFQEWMKTDAPKTSKNFPADFAAFYNLNFTSRSVSDFVFDPAHPKAAVKDMEIVFEFPTDEDRTHFILRMPPV